jgi:hypothetical protein
MIEWLTSAPSNQDRINRNGYFRLLENSALGLGPKEVNCIIEAYEQALHTLCVKDRDDPLTENNSDEDHQDRANWCP